MSSAVFAGFMVGVGFGWSARVIAGLRQQRRQANRVYPFTTQAYLVEKRSWGRDLWR